MRDADAFVFDMNQSYTPTDPSKAIFTLPNGFCFGEGALAVTGDVLNEVNNGKCRVGANTFYNIVGG